METIEKTKYNYKYFFEKYINLLTDKNCMELYNYMSGDIELEKTFLPQELKDEITQIKNNNKIPTKEQMDEINKLKKEMGEEQFSIAYNNIRILNELKEKGVIVKT